jgi:hypothetical protein
MPLYQNQSMLILNFPTAIQFLSISCLKMSTNLILVSCIQISNKVKVTLQYNQLSTLYSTKFSIEAYKNYPYLQEYSIEANLYNSNL